MGFMMNLLSFGGFHTCWPSANELSLLSANDIINECTNMGLRFLRIMMIACKLTMKTVSSFGRTIEMAKVWMAFQLLNDDESIPPT
jgi:hypothetical protein